MLYHCTDYMLYHCIYRFYVWDLLHASIRKMNKQVAQLQIEVEEKRDKKDEADNKVSDGLDIDDDVPTEEDIERLEEELENAQSDQKNLFLIIFQVHSLICWLYLNSQSMTLYMNSLFSARLQSNL